MGRKKKSNKGSNKVKISKTKKTKTKVAFDQTSRHITYKPKNIKGNEIKIKKIIKQPTEKKIYNVKDYVVYPKHGIGKIVSIEKAKIGSIDITFYKVYIEKEKLTLSIPLNQQSHLRYVSSINQINKSISILKSKPKEQHETLAIGGKSSHGMGMSNDLISSLGLESRIQKKLDMYTNSLKLQKVAIDNSWFNIQDIGSILKLHMHTRSLISAALYINVDEKSSPLFFYNPNSLTHFTYSLTSKTQSDFNFHHQSFQPKNGEMYIFPSWLLHGSNDEQNKTKDRTVISFNAS